MSQLTSDGKQGLMLGSGVFLVGVLVGGLVFGVGGTVGLVTGASAATLVALIAAVVLWGDKVGS